MVYKNNQKRKEERYDKVKITFEIIEENIENIENERPLTFPLAVLGDEFKKKYQERVRELEKRDEEEIQKRRIEYQQTPEYKAEAKMRMKEYSKKYWKRSDIKEKEKNRFKKKYKTDKTFNAIFKLRAGLRQTFRRYIKTKKIQGFQLYGVNFQAIIEHLKPFPEDYLKKPGKWHIDHIRPLASFNFVNPDGSQNLEEIRKAHVPENFQWLTAEENLSKGSKFNKEFK